jgi:hypothetical protein
VCVAARLKRHVLERRQVFASESALQVRKGLRIFHTGKLQHGSQVGLHDPMDERRHVTAQVGELHGRARTGRPQVIPPQPGQARVSPWA